MKSGIKALAVVFVLLFASCSAFAGGGSFIGKITPYQISVPSGYKSGTLSYGFNHLLANSPSGEVIELVNHAWQGKGFSASRPSWTPLGIACYDNGYPSIWEWEGTPKHVTEDAKFSAPFVTPSGSVDARVCFGQFTTDFLLVANPNGAIDGFSPFDFLNWDGSWWTTSAAFVYADLLYIAGQNTKTAVNNGYRVVKKDCNGFSDTGWAYSEIAYGGGMLWGISPDHRKVEAWDIASWDGPKKYVVEEGGYYNMIGAGNKGAMYQAGSLIMFASTTAVPEPSSILAMLTGLVGLSGAGWRLRKK